MTDPRRWRMPRVAPFVAGGALVLGLVAAGGAGPQAVEQGAEVVEVAEALELPLRHRVFGWRGHRRRPTRGGQRYQSARDRQHSSTY